MLNINIGHNEKFLEASKTLHNYSEYIRRVRKYAETMSIYEYNEKEQANTERERHRADN